jgi:hypothetical protein
MQTMWIVVIGLILVTVIFGGVITGKLQSIAHSTSAGAPPPGQTLAQSLFH